MHLVSQISGNNRRKILALRDILEQQNVTVTHLGLEDEFLSAWDDAWFAHYAELAMYESIDQSSFHAVYNENGFTSRDLALQILYAMLKNKPILICELPTFADDVDTFTQRLISSRLHSFAITNLTKAQRAEINSALRHLANTKIDYMLSPHDEVLIRSKVRNYLRELTNQRTPAEAIDKTFGGTVLSAA